MKYNYSMLSKGKTTAYLFFAQSVLVYSCFTKHKANRSTFN